MRSLPHTAPRGSSWLELCVNTLGARLLIWWGVAYTFLPDVVFSGRRIGVAHDEHYFLMHEEVARRTIVEFFQLPLWNPFFCGGIPELANPQSTFLAPDFIFRLLAGSVVGRKLAVLFMLVLGMEGTYRLSRRWKNSVFGSLLAAILFSTSGWFSEYIRIGWLNFFTGNQLLPWAVLFFSQAVERRQSKKCIYAAATITWMLFCGGTYTVPYTVVTLGVLGVFYTLLRSKKYTQPVRLLYPWKMFAITGVLSVGLGAIRLFPIAELIQKFPRHWYAPEHNSVQSLIQALMGAQGPGVPTIQIGWPSFSLLMLGLLSFDKLTRRYFMACVLFLLIAAGKFAPWSPYALIEHLPVLGDLRRPEGYAIVLALFWSLGSGRGLSLLEKFTNKRLSFITHTTLPSWLKAAIPSVAALLMCVIGTSIAVNAVNSRQVAYGTVYNEAPLARYHAEFRQAKGNRWDAHIWPFINRGSLACFEETPFPQSSELRGDLDAEEFPLDATFAKVTRKHWSPNRIDLQVEAKRPSLIVINQNYDSKWRSTVGKIVNYRQRIAVKMPPGSHRLSLVYRDCLAYAGIATSLLTLILCINLLLKRFYGSTRT